MIPLKDDAPRVSTPYVNVTLIVLNTLAFLFELSLGGQNQQLLQVFGVVPVRLSIVLFDNGYVPSKLVEYFHTSYVPPMAAILPLFTSMFLHGSWLHLIFNMWALWIFGDNVEDRLGHTWYLLFYLICGVAAALFHNLLNADSTIPTVGASGAIAGVMGAYFLLYPRARVLTLVPLFFVFFVWLPAWVVLGYWFVAQFLSGAATSIALSGSTNSAGIAFWAHVGGFLAGMLLIKLFPSRARRYHYGW
jgi:membrane associated rhomboid family serine protease